jgi:mannose-6-phosphate isomerase-like protein (cupin superfamily)
MARVDVSAPRRWGTAALPRQATYTAPSGKTEIRMLPNLPSGEITHATLGSGETSKPAYLDVLHEFFFVLSGKGELWRRVGRCEEVVELRPGRCVSIPPGVDFQYRTLDRPMAFLVVVAPRWSEDHWHEAAEGFWAGETREALADHFAQVGPKPWATLDLPDKPNYMAPDSSEIRLLLECDAGGIAHARLPAHAISQAVCHRTVDEVWYVVAGQGQVWRRSEDVEESVTVRVDTCLTIPVGTDFQFRALGSSSLDVIIGTFPRWPGPDEAVETHGIWEPCSARPAD